MIRRFSLPLVALAAALLSLPACAQPAPRPAATDADPALWVVKDDDTTVYLFGTIHVLKPGLTWFDEAVKTAFDASDTLVLEMVEPDMATQERVVGTKAFDPAQPALTKQLPPNYAAALTKATAEGGVPAKALDMMRPWFAAMTVTLLPIQKLGYDSRNGPEGVLSAAAGKAGKPVRGLETFEGQLSIFDALSRDAELQLLKSTIDELPQAGPQMDRMVKNWSAGDPDALAGLMNESLKDSPEVEKALLTDRNARWAGWIAERMRTPGTVFVAVGAGHLAGPRSVQAMLAGNYRLTAQRVRY